MRERQRGVGRVGSPQSDPLAIWKCLLIFGGSAVAWQRFSVCHITDNTDPLNGRHTAVAAAAAATETATTNSNSNNNYYSSP